MINNILITGAGRSSGALIDYLSRFSVESGWTLTVADVSLEAARSRTRGHSNAKPVAFDVHDSEARAEQVSKSGIVISLLPPQFHQLLAEECIRQGRHFITASYLTSEMRSLDEQAKKKGVLLLNECGLDPGIDHMSAVNIIDRLRTEGAVLKAFRSYTGGLVAPESNDNPWGYKFSWNPRNVILAGQGTAKYIYEGKFKYIPYNRLFTDIEMISVAGVGNFDGYANRDSISYRKTYGLEHIDTLLRGTLRSPGFCRAWNVLVQLGMTDDSYLVTGLPDLTYASLIRSLLPASFDSISDLREAVASFCHLPSEGEAISMVAWTGILEDEPVGIPDASPARILQHLLEQKWVLKPDDHDMIVMQHRFDYVKDGLSKILYSDLVVQGIDSVHTAMAMAVGWPLGIVTKLLIEKKLNLTGVHIPVMKSIYDPVLAELEGLGIKFEERTTG
jgi:saccharopine dehydrogenase-like NADP-dependent oxidoreductase